MSVAHYYQYRGHAVYHRKPNGLVLSSLNVANRLKKQAQQDGAEI